MKKFTTLEEDLIKEAAGAQEAFDKGFKEANDKLLQIRVALEDFKDKQKNEPRNWEYAGSMGYINEQLDEVLNHLPDDTRNSINKGETLRSTGSLGQ
jgi:hypothetical protein